jgi:hypothetical protein
MSPRHWGLLQFGHVLAMRIHVLAGSDRWRVPGGIKRLADTALVARSGTVGGALQLPRAGARAERDEQHDDVGAVTGLRTCPSAGLAAGDLADGDLAAGDLAARGAGAHRDMASRLVRDRPLAAESARNCARATSAWRATSEILTKVLPKCLSDRNASIRLDARRGWRSAQRDGVDLFRTAVPARQGDRAGACPAGTVPEWPPVAVAPPPPAGQANGCRAGQPL